MNYLIRLIITAIVVVLISKILGGVYVDGLTTSLIVALILSFLNTFIRPLLVFFTFPLTILTFGLFLFVVNAMIIQLCDYFIDSFRVDGLLTAIIFSILLTISQTILFKITNVEKKK